MTRQICRVCKEPLSDEDITMHRSTHWDCEEVYNGELKQFVAMKKQPINGYQH